MVLPAPFRQREGPRGQTIPHRDPLGVETLFRLA